VCVAIVSCYAHAFVQAVIVTDRDREPTESATAITVQRNIVIMTMLLIKRKRKTTEDTFRNYADELAKLKTI